MNFHVVSLPHTQTTAAYPSCAFTQKVVRFCRMMKARGHHVTLYAGAPAGYVGTSGVKIFDPTVINHRARRWALAGL